MVDVLKEHTDPNQRCTCGWRRFRETFSSSEEDTTRWVFYDAEGSGFGATEFGTYFGAGSSGAWGEFESTLRVCGSEVRCENCTRLRLSKTVSRSTILGAYVWGTNFYVVAGDVTRVGCFTVEWRGPVTLTSFLKVSSDAFSPLLISDLPITGPLASPPAGVSLASVLLKTSLPAVPVAGDYEAVIVNSCCGFEIPLGTVSLEVDVIVLNPGDADLNGFPALWVSRGGPASVTQPARGSIEAIPFDYCDAVLEYDARFGTLPSAQGWTHQTGGAGAPGNFALVEGGVLRVATPGGTNSSYWENDATLASPPDSQIHTYAVFIGGSGPHGNPGEGLDFQALVGRNGFTHSGARFTMGGFLYHTALGTGSEAAWAGSPEFSGWNNVSVERYSVGDAFVVRNEILERTSIYGVGAVAGADEVRARFGDVLGEGVTAGLVRNFVVSHSGRFMRAWFRAYATVAAPVLRLYVTSDLDGSGETLARFLVRYGPVAPYAVPTLQAGASVAFTVRNTSFEVPITLPGLTANQPFWFTVERDWQHADNRTLATVWLTQATVRGA